MDQHMESDLFRTDLFRTQSRSGVDASSEKPYKMALYLAQAGRGKLIQIELYTGEPLDVELLLGLDRTENQWSMFLE